MKVCWEVCLPHQGHRPALAVLRCAALCPPPRTHNRHTRYIAHRREGSQEAEQEGEEAAAAGGSAAQGGRPGPEEGREESLEDWLASLSDR